MLQEGGGEREKEKWCFFEGRESVGGEGYSRVLVGGGGEKWWFSEGRERVLGKRRKRSGGFLKGEKVLGERVI